MGKPSPREGLAQSWEAVDGRIPVPRTPKPVLLPLNTFPFVILKIKIIFAGLGIEPKNNLLLLSYIPSL